MAKEDRHKTAYLINCVMPFGLQGAPATFQRLMDRVLQGRESFAEASMLSSSWEEHLQHVEEVLKHLREEGLTVNLKKCQFDMAYCVYLGHLVGSGEVRPEPSSS